LKKKKTLCRNRIADIKEKNTAWCQYCKHRALHDIYNKCDCCQKKIVKEITHASALKRFERICTDPSYRKIIDDWVAYPYDHSDGPFWLIKIGHQIFGVDIKYFAEYIELPGMEGTEDKERPNDTKYDIFIKDVRKHAQLVAVTWSDD
jgi:hypothetical protein